MVAKAEMSDEEFEIYADACTDIYKRLQDLPTYLIVTVLIKVLVSTYLQTKGFREDTPGALQLHDELITNLTHELIDRTNQNIVERN